VAGKRLLIVADGALQYVPFAALPSNGQPLIVNHEIVNLPSASVLAALRLDRDRPSYQKTVAVFADPVFDAADPRLARARRTDSATAAADVAQLPEEVRASVREAGLLDDRGALTRLPFTREEADAILALAPSGEGTKAIDFSASRSTATSGRVKGHRIVHLATHGIVDTAHPELSGIVLSLVDERGAPQDGFLRLHEVYNLDWNADLVVLSACQTALGQEIKGEGLVGLTRGFMYGGARGVVASLWNVNDSATVDLMKRFYEGLLARGLTPAPALRAAQLEMWKRRQWQAPYYWAAFTLQGDWR
jgi:CHAT domain-containing protein